MALINCLECGSEISDKAEKCPKCGYPLKPVDHTPTIEHKTEGKISSSSFRKWLPYFKLLLLIIPIIGIAGTLPFYYVPSSFKVFPKGKLTFKHTIISKKDINDLLDDYNHCENIYQERLIENDPLFKKLVEHGVMRPIDRIKNRTWGGQIYRFKDDKKLSEVKLKMQDDTIFVYANAIFGANNDTLLFVKYDVNDSVFTYKNTQGETILFKSKYLEQNNQENLYFSGVDFYLVLNVSNVDISSPGVLDFYQHITVPRESYMYLDGAYEGQMEMENDFKNYIFQEGLGFKIKMVFEDGFKVRTIFNGTGLYTGIFALGSDPDVKVEKYTIKGDKIYVGGKGVGIKIADYGSKLVWQDDEFNIILRKIY